MSKLVYYLPLGALASALLHAPAFAQDDASADEEGEAQIVVTGSRIARDGYDAPTPLTVVGTQDINASAPVNLADFVNEIPSLVGSVTPANSNLSLSSGTAGVNGLNLRSLGVARTLVLLDGQRSVGATSAGVVDVNNFPQALVRSVEIVTGGASAAYGSDAVSGVVNFILDRDFTGLKGDAQYGETTYGDGANYALSLAGGMPFAGGRGHVLASVEYTKKEGIYGVPRDWNNDGWYQILNPAYAPGNGEPELLVTPMAGLGNATPGGLITNTALRGTYFGVNGAVGQFAYGAVRDRWMVGGDWEYVQVNDTQSLEPEEARTGVFGRLSYEVFDGVELFAQASWNRTENKADATPLQQLGNVTIRSDNAFLPASVKAQMSALGLTSFLLGTTNADIPLRKIDNDRETERYVIGAEGSFSALGRDFAWDVYYQRGITNTVETLRDITNNARFNLATDAVFHPTTGAIVCRVNVDTNPSNDDPACVPINRLGIGVASPEAIAYVIGDPTRDQTFRQEVIAANVSFDLLELPAGAVGAAVGVEHRFEKMSGEVDPQYSTGWAVGNFLPSFGDYEVNEAYLELLIPILDWVEFNGAIRGTDYSTSGFVSTWKLGLSVQPIPDIRLRATRSRDIRAPNLGELFQGGTTRVNTILDPFNGNVAVAFAGTTSGNPALRPEKADQWGVGIVATPQFVPGLAFSVDYYDIKLSDGVGSIGAQTALDRCFDGIQEYCAAVVRGPNPYGTNLQVFETPFNFASQRSRGIDFEASYTTGLDEWFSGAGGDLSLRAMATHFIEDYSDDGLSTPTDAAGQNSGGSPPSWLYRFTATYSAEPIRVGLVGRGISDGVYDNDNIECTSGCPLSTTDNPTINDNHIDGAFYLDANIAYEFDIGGAQSELFFIVRNLFNKDPPIVTNGPGGSAPGQPSTNQALYDLLGRTFRIGVRFEL